MPRITEIMLYPIKSCAGVSVESARLEPRGFLWDRRYMLVDRRGRVLTQREHPKMARILVRKINNGWAIDTEGQETLELPDVLGNGPERTVRIWNDRLELAAVGKGCNKWFTEALGLPCQLMQMNEQHLRPIKAGRGRAGDLVSLADGAPVLLTSEASLAALNDRLENPLQMGRFRSNLVMNADDAFAEDSWRQIRVGEVEFDVEWSCTRCIVTTIDPETGSKDSDGEPIRSLKEFRSGPEGVMFGQNLIPRHLGTVSVGDTIEVLEDIDA